MVRRLPVLQSSDVDDRRPSWHWLLIGAGFTITLWLPLAMLALWVGPRLALELFDVPDGQSLEQVLAAASSARQRLAAVVQALPLLLSFFLACFASATLVGRFGGAAGRREATLANLVGSGMVLCLAAASGGLTLPVGLGAGGFLALSSLIGGWGGARVGKRLRPGPGQ
jgi:hypothetical protein